MESIFNENSGSKALVPSQLTKHREVQLPDGNSSERNHTQDHLLFMAVFSIFISLGVDLLYEIENEVHKSCCLEIYYQVR